MTCTTWGITWSTAHYFFYLIPCIFFAVLLLLKKLWWQKRTAALLNGPGGRQSVVNDSTNFTKDPRSATRGSKTLGLHHFSLTKKILKTLLLLTALFCLVLALARPGWDDSKEVVSQEGRDVLIALDISRSMLARDHKDSEGSKTQMISRLDAAKKKIKELVNSFGAERVCLMIFSGVPFIQCPFTTDIGAFLNFLDQVDAESISSGTTALDKALQAAIGTFEAMPTRKHKIMVIFTDGEDFSPSLMDKKEKIQQMGLSVFTIGLGTPEGAPIPLADEQGRLQGHLKDQQGAVVITRLNEPLLKKLSHDTGARYLHATSDSHDIDQLVTDVKRFEKEKFDDRLVSSKQEKYFIFAAISLLCLLCEWLL